MSREIEVFDEVKEALTFIMKVLKGFKKDSGYQVIHSTSLSCITEEDGDMDEIEEILLKYLQDLDSQQGFMLYDPTESVHWDFLESESLEEVMEEESMAAKIINEADQAYVSAGEGFAVIYNPDVIDGGFPIIVVKKSFWRKVRYRAIGVLQTVKPGQDPTTKISPAVYVEWYG